MSSRESNRCTTLRARTSTLCARTSTPRTRASTGRLATATHRVKRAAVVVGLLFAVAAPLRAQTLDATRPPDVAVPRVGFSFLGLRPGQPATPALELALVDLTPLFWRVSPIAGLIASAKGAAYGYGGLQVPVSLPLGLVARPSVSIGLYTDGRGMDLGHALEFRDAFLLERAVTGSLTLSAVFYHLSNAGLGRRNPGTEAVGIGLSFIPARVLRSAAR